MFFVSAGLLLVAVLAAGGEKTASQLFKEGQKAERSGDAVRAYLLYSEAASLDPANISYWFRSQALRSRAALMAKPAPRRLDDIENGAVSPTQVSGEPGRISDRDLAEARLPQPPTELKASGGRQDLDFRGDAKSLFEQVAHAYGLEAVFDSDYQPGAPLRFRLDGADYRDALRAMEAATASFVAPLGDRLFLVVNDTPQKRAELEPTVSVAIPVPAPVSLQEAQELVRVVQQTMALLRFVMDSQRRLVLMRDRISKVRPAQALFEQLLRYPAQVSIEVEILEASRTSSTSYGLSLQTLFPLVAFGDVFNSTPAIPSGFTRFAVFGGGKSLFGIGVADAQVFARMDRSEARTLLKTEIRSLDSQPASIHFGERYPIITGGFLGQVTGGEQSTFPPAFNFEDLGLVLKVTPHVHGREDVSLELEAEVKVLTGQSLNSIPIIANRKLQSQVRLRTGEWAVVAGLMDAQEARTITGPAGLSSLPFLGKLLRKNDRSHDTRNVFIVLKPTLISLPPGEQATRVIWIGSETRPLTPL